RGVAVRMPRAAALALAAALLVAACGDTTPTQAPRISATPAASLVPSVSTPASGASGASSSGAPPASSSGAAMDTAAAFVAVLSNPSFAADIAVTGIRQAGTTSERTTGAIDLAAGAYRVALQRAVKGRVTATDRIGAGQDRFLKRLGLWFQAT